MGYIGMTEAGDAGWDLSWYDKIKNRDACLGGILITKAGHNSRFQEKALDLLNYKPIIIHFGVTGWGGSDMEPGTCPPEDMIESIRHFIDSGFPAKNVVIRIDPIIPTPEGLSRAVNVLRLVTIKLPDVTRVRLSIYDDYHHSREEMCRRGYPSIDNISKWKNEMERRPTPETIRRVVGALFSVPTTLEFELCAEPELEQFYPDKFHWFGCLAKKDLDIMVIPLPDGIGINGQHRYGCRCLQMKTELLQNKRRCANDCAYCYWKNPPCNSIAQP